MLSIPAASGFVKPSSFPDPAISETHLFQRIIWNLVGHIYKYSRCTFRTWLKPLIHSVLKIDYIERSIVNTRKFFIAKSVINSGFRVSIHRTILCKYRYAIAVFNGFRYKIIYNFLLLFFGNFIIRLTI